MFHVTRMFFSTQGFLRGFRLSLPLAASVGAYGLLFGMLAQKAGMKEAEALLMSLTLFAGASQLIATELWHFPLPILTIILTTFVVNARHLLMGAAVQPYFKNLKPMQAYGTLFFCADENWALAMRAFQNGERDTAFLFGGGVAVYLGWVSSTWLGYAGGLVIKNPAVYGLDFAFTACFVFLLVGFWSGKKDFLPWMISAVTAIAASHFFPGKWYILIGALVGSLWNIRRS